jgi:hypothetical protein
MTTKTCQHEDKASTLIEDLTVSQDGEVRGGQLIGVGELQETIISKNMDSTSSIPIARSDNNQHGTHVAGTIGSMGN